MYELSLHETDLFGGSENKGGLAWFNTYKEAITWAKFFADYFHEGEAIQVTDPEGSEVYFIHALS